MREVAGPVELGFVGAGRMGRPMVRRLVEAGHGVRVYARTPEARRALDRDGVTVVASAPEAARGAEAVLVCVRTDAQIREVCVDGGLVAALPGDAVLAVHTTGDPRTVRELADRGAEVVDVPVSGGPHDVEAGRLAVFAGGEEVSVERIGPALRAYADPVLHVGPLGAGLRVKLLNNLLFAAHLGLLADVVRLGEGFGVSEPVLLDAMAHGSAASRAVAGAAARGGVAGLAGSAGPFLRKDLSVAGEIVRDLGLDLGALRAAVHRLDPLLADVE